jgi:hypothetical protein
MKSDIEITRILRSPFYYKMSYINIFTAEHNILFLMPPEFYSTFEGYNISYLLLIPINQVPNHMSIFHCLHCSKASVKSPGIIFHNMPVYYGEGLLASHQIPKLNAHPLRAVCDSLFNIFTVTLTI